LISAIIDISHHQTVDLAKVKAGGIIAVIHKATEGASVRDAEYPARRDAARALGLLWGAYHYASGASVSAQVENFLEYALLGDDDVMALDWEASTEGPDMTLEQARRFAQMIRGETGRWPMIYGGRMLREAVGAQRDDVLAQCPLWYSRYRTAPIGIPTGTWPAYTLWQCTDGNTGPEPHFVNGVGRCDRERFAGTAAQLREQWPFSRREDDVPLGPGLASIRHASAPTKARKEPRKRRERHAGTPRSNP
jgi:lysozyme